MQAIFVSRPTSSIIDVTGRDRLSFLQGMLTNDVSGPIPASGLRAFHLDNKGAVVYPMTLIPTSKSVYLDVEGAIASEVIESLDHYLVMERCTLRDVLSVMPSYWLYGNLTAVFGSDNIRTDGHLHVVTVGACEIFCFPVLRSAHPCFVIWSMQSDIPVVLQGMGVFEGTFSDAEQMRLSAGIPVGVTDFGKILAMESGVTKTSISFTKGCYIGQEVVARIDARGRTHRELVLLDIADDVQNSEVKVGDSTVGHIRSFCRQLSGTTRAICHLRHDARRELLNVGGAAVLKVMDVQ